MIICPICNFQNKEENFLLSFFSNYNQQEYRLYQCLRCGIQWWDPLKMIVDFYIDEEEEGYKEFHLGLIKNIKDRHKMFFKYIPVKAGKLLDIGCGDGTFLKEAEKFGYEVWGIDFDNKSIKICQEKRKLRQTYSMNLYEFVNYAKKAHLQFDLITFFEVLEHQDSPQKFIEIIKNLLKPGGWIAGSVPNRKLIKYFNKSLNYLPYNFPPHHFLWFDSKSLFFFFNKNGFSDIFIIEVSQENFYRNIKKNTLRFMYALTGIKGIYLRDKFKKSWKIENRIFNKISKKLEKITRYLLLGPFTLLLYPLTEKENLYFQAKFLNKRDN